MEQKKKKKKTHCHDMYIHLQHSPVLLQMFFFLLLKCRYNLGDALTSTSSCNFSFTKWHATHQV